MDDVSVKWEGRDYNHDTNWPTAFAAIRQDPKNDGTLERQILKEHVEQVKLFQRMPRDLMKFFEDGATEKTSTVQP